MRILYCILSFLLINGAFGQGIYLSDNFEDGDLEGWGQSSPGDWAASGSGAITGSFSLKHNLSGITESSHIHHTLTGLNLDSGTTTWRLNLKNGNWDPSTTDKFWVYLMVDDTTNVSGYAVGVNLSGESDTLTLWKLTGSVADGAVITSDFNWDANDLVGIEVTRDSLGLWELKYDSDGGFDNLVSAGTGTDVTYTTTNYFGLTFYFTSTGAGAVWLDDVTVSRGVVILASLKSFLQGPFDVDSMSTSLNSSGYLPLSQPFSGSPWNYNGGESVQSIPEGVVDWVLVELRTGAEASTKVASRAAFIESDGMIVDTLGINPVSFPGIDEGNYYIVIQHRNHLAIMSDETHALSKFSNLYDFSTGLDKTYGTNAMVELSSGIYGMYTGDANANGQVQNDDKNDFWEVQTGASGYKEADFNLNGQVQNDDKNDFWKVNVGLGTQVPF